MKLSVVKNNLFITVIQTRYILQIFNYINSIRLKESIKHHYLAIALTSGEKIAIQEITRVISKKSEAWFDAEISERGFEWCMSPPKTKTSIIINTKHIRYVAHLSDKENISTPVYQAILPCFPD